MGMLLFLNIVHFPNPAQANVRFFEKFYGIKYILLCIYLYSFSFSSFVPSMCIGSSSSKVVDYRQVLSYIDIFVFI